MCFKVLNSVASAWKQEYNILTEDRELSSFGNMGADVVKGILTFAVLFAMAKILLSSGTQIAQDMGSAIMVGLAIVFLVVMALVYKAFNR